MLLTLRTKKNLRKLRNPINPYVMSQISLRGPGFVVKITQKSLFLIFSNFSMSNLISSMVTMFVFKIQIVC